MRTVALALDAKAAALRHEHNARAVLAWNIAALSRAKRLPDVKTLFARERTPRQTAAEAEALMKQWYAAQERRRTAEKAD